MLSVLKYILALILILLMVIMSCTAPRMSHVTPDDVAGAPIPHGMHRYIHDGEHPEPVCKHFYVQESLPETDSWEYIPRCICVFCKSIIRCPR
jgi:hypothetical protein